jgi:type II secretory pathway pseudopilin PulG
MRNKQKGFSLVEGLLIFVIVGILAGTGWYVWNSNKKTNDLLNSADKNSTSAFATKQTKKPVEPQIPNDWQWFESSDKTVKFAYPKTWGMLGEKSQKESENNYNTDSFMQPVVITAKKDLLIQIFKSYADFVWYFWDTNKDIFVSAEDQKAPTFTQGMVYNKPVELGTSNKVETLVDNGKGHAVYHVLGKGAMNCGSSHYFFVANDKVVHLTASVCERGGEWEPQKGQQYKDVVDDPLKDIYKYIQD